MSMDQFKLFYVQTPFTQISRIFLFSGWLFATRAIGPLIGYAMGAWATSMYVDLTGKVIQLINRKIASKLFTVQEFCKEMFNLSAKQIRFW